jgi:WXG100 family type VII secretion target
MADNDEKGMKVAGLEFGNAFDDVSKIMVNLGTELGNFREEWKGQASRKFDEAMGNWGAEFDKLLRQLDAMADKLIGGAGNVADAEDFAENQGSFFHPAGGK